MSHSPVDKELNWICKLTLYLVSVSSGKTTRCDLGQVWSVHTQEYNHVWWHPPELHHEPAERAEGKDVFLYSSNTLRPKQNGWYFADDTWKWIFFNKEVWIMMMISLKFVPEGPINKFFQINTLKMKTQFPATNIIRSGCIRSGCKWNYLTGFDFTAATLSTSSSQSTAWSRITQTVQVLEGHWRVRWFFTSKSPQMGEVRNIWCLSLTISAMIMSPCHNISLKFSSM